MPDRPATQDDAGDRDLVRRMAAGDAGAVARLYDAFAPTLYALALRLVDEPADAEEVLLDGFTQAWQGASQYSPARGSVAAWLTVIVRSRALDQIRSRGRRSRAVKAAAALDPDGAPALGTPLADPAQAALATERRRYVEDALRQLPVAQREMLELAYFHGLSQSEIADRLEEPLGTVKTRIRAGMQKLKELLRPLA